MISTRGRYALRVMVDLAEHGGEAYIPLKEVVARQKISQKYLESIMGSLSKAGFVEGVHGKGGGYRLARTPEEYRIGDILRLTEGTLAPVECLACSAEPCDREEECRTHPMWSRLDELITSYLDSVTLADLMRKPGEAAREARGGDWEPGGSV